MLACGRTDAMNDSATSATASMRAAESLCLEEGAPTITAGGVGPLRIGRKLSEISSRCMVRDTSFSLGEGIRENGRVVTLGSSSAVLIVSGDADPTITRIIVADSTLHADGGIGVGKTIGALRASYGRICPMVGEGRVVVAVPDLPGVSFGTSTTLASLPRGGADIERTPEAIRDTETITSIWVHGGRSTCGGS
jgi:hypothetical protein